MYALSSQFSLLSVCGRSCFDVTARLSPGLHFARFVTHPEVNLRVFRRLKRGEENSISKIFYDLHIRIPCRFDQENKKISVIYTLSLSPSCTAFRCTSCFLTHVHPRNQKLNHKITTPSQFHLVSHNHGLLIIPTYF